MNRLKAVGLMVMIAAVAAGAGVAWGQSRTQDVEVRVAARSVEDGRIEFAIEYDGERVLPRGRYMNSRQINARNDNWLRSTPVTINVPIEGATASPSSAPSAPETIRGTGQAVQPLSLAAGVYYCDVSIRGNSTDYGAGHFSVTFEGRTSGYELLANEIAATWQGRKKITVGDGLFNFQGTIDVEVSAEAAAEWAVACTRQ